MCETKNKIRFGVLVDLWVCGNIFALETVNLIKDASFEKDSELWQTYTGGELGKDSAEVSRHDPEKPFSGLCSAYCDTRKYPGDAPTLYADSGVIIQGFCCSKKVEDMDSLLFYYVDIPVDEGWGTIAFIDLYVGSPIDWFCGYKFRRAGDPSGTPPRVIKAINFPEDTFWNSFTESVRTDLLDAGIPPGASVDSLRLIGFGFAGPDPDPWRGQKVYWDDIRLMGYADYDVGVKEILSGDSLEVGTPYQLVARIKNFGRENADSFLVIAEIKDGASIIHSDTLPWSLEGDTEDTVTFADFDPSTTGPYTLTIRTHMEPDECDEDDELSKEIGHSAVSESPLPEGLSLEVVATSRGVLKVSFETPNGQVANLSVYDATGRRIERMAVTRSGRVEFNSALASGVYLVRLESKQATVTKKAVLVR